MDHSIHDYGPNREEHRALFHANYRRWLDESLREYNSGYSSRTYHQESLPDPVDYNPEELVEIAENGDVYPHSYGGTGHISRVCTPWERSCYNNQHFEAINILSRTRKADRDAAATAHALRNVR